MGDSQFPEAEGPSSVSTYQDEDFLFHLYRGSELLQDNCVPEAKEELERALSMRPRDVESQGLLGVVYFRLGLYPRAIQIYEQLIRDVPREVTPRVNLALCYLKTGQLPQARDTLEEVIRRVPDHQRAWGYLGLVFERQGDFVKAQASFDRAGQPQMARRMQQLVDEQQNVRASRAPEPPSAEHLEVRQAAADAAEQLEHDARKFSSPSVQPSQSPIRGRWIEPGQEVVPPPSHIPRAPAPGRFGPVVPSVPVSSFPAEPAPAAIADHQSPSELAKASLLTFPDHPSTVRHGPRLATVRSEPSFIVRLDALRAVVPVADSVVRYGAVHRRGRGRENAEHLGAPHTAFTQVNGSADLMLAIREGEMFVLALAGEFLFVREQRLVGFDAALNYESGRLPVETAERPALVQLSGRGTVIIDAICGLASLPVSAESSVLLRAEQVVGWTGRLVPRAVPAAEAPGAILGLSIFSGDGAIFVDTGGSIR